MIEKIKSKLRSALNNAKTLTTGNLAHNKACVELMVEESLKDIDNIVTEERERCIKAAQDWYCIRCCDTSGEECHYCHIKEHIRKAMEGGNNGND